MSDEAQHSAQIAGGDLSFLVRYMKAPRIAEALSQIADRARAESWTYERFLEEMLEREVFARQQQGGETRIRRLASRPARPSTDSTLVTRRRCAGRWCYTWPAWISSRGTRM